MPEPQKSPLRPDTAIQYLKGAGPKLAGIFKPRGLLTVEDFILRLPRGYQDNRHLPRLSEAEPGRHVTAFAEVMQKKIIPLRGRGRNMYEIIIGDGSAYVPCKFFRMPYKQWFNSLRVGERVEVRGAASFYRGRLEFHHPQIFPAKPPPEKPPGGGGRTEGFRGEAGPEAQKEPAGPPRQQERDLILPLYTEIEGVSQNKIRSLMKTALQALEKAGFGAEMEWLPRWLREKYRLPGLWDSLKGLHFPDGQSADDYLDFKTEFQKRIIFDEFFELQFYLALKKRGWRQGEAPKIPISESLLKELSGSLPFQLTNAQKKVLGHIFSDLKSAHPMHRLIQGDVGCGKTAVALMAAAMCARAGFQTALMAPTEILAEQHFRRAAGFLEPFGIKAEKLTGKMKAREKRTAGGLIQSGLCSVCIGTHALIQEDVRFHKLGLVIVDEQHRFGAHQRALLKAKGGHPHFLVMTATPIPRTLSLALYGDLEVSVIDEMPAGRKPVTTKRVFYSGRLEAFNFMRDEVKKGRQAYVVYPLVEESEKLDLKNAMSQYEKLKNYYKELKWGLLTGRMSSEEKREAMDRFRRNEIQVLVSTTVIEVGVDAPNATLMLIEHAERFGLSQMHQLRGRVGRGTEKSWCFVILGQRFSQESKERAFIMERESSGFRIAEKDLEFRGPGEFLGSRQSGMPGFKMANIIRDAEILTLAKKAAFELAAKDPELALPDHMAAKIKFQKLMEKVRPG